MSGTSELPLRLWVLGIPMIAVLVGLVAGADPAYAVAASFAAVYLVLVLLDIAIGLAFFLGLSFLESVPGLSSLSLAKAAGALLVLAWVAHVATTEKEERSRLLQDNPLAVAAMVTFGTWAAASALWATDATIAIDSAQRWVLNLVMFPVTYAAIRYPRHVTWMFAVFVVGALTSAAIGVVQSGGAGVEDRLGGSGVNANQLGELMVVVVVLSATMVACRDLPIAGRGLAAIGVVLGLLTLLSTASRGALVGLAVALVCAPLLIGPKRRLLAISLIVIAVGSTAVYLTTIAPQADVQHLTEGDTSGSGRTDIWKVGWRMVEANPVLGVGAGNYANSTIHYLFEPGVIDRVDYIINDPKAAHNIYLQALAELGIVGLTLFLSVVALCLAAVRRAAHRFRDLGDKGMEIRSRGLLIALVGLLAALFFSTAIYSKQLWLLLGLCLAVERLSQLAVSRAGGGRG